MWNFMKKLKKETAEQSAVSVQPAQEKSEDKKITAEAADIPAAKAEAKIQAPVKNSKPHAQKTDDELAEELNAVSPEILSQAKTPEMRKMVIDIYRAMLIDGVDVKNDKAVKKWLQKHPELASGGSPAPKVETVRRAEPKVGRNDPCPCGTGKKYKKCCGA